MTLEVTVYEETYSTLVYLFDNVRHMRIFSYVIFMARSKKLYDVYLTIFKTVPVNLFCVLNMVALTLDPLSIMRLRQKQIPHKKF